MPKSIIVYCSMLCFGAGMAIAAWAENPVSSTIQSDRPHAPYPWTHIDADTHDDTFTFAVFADITGGEREGVFDIAVTQLNALRPELIINVGDLIEGGSDDVKVLNAQWDAFDERARRARAPVFYVGGNIPERGTRGLRTD